MDWLAHELLTGFQKLLCLGLDRTPAEAVIDGTVLAWHEAITVGRSWEQARDTPRIRAAFVTLANTRESWPAPRHFLDALPRMEQAALRYEVKPLSPAEAEARMAELRRMLDEPVADTESERDVPRRLQTTTDTATAERELRAHYDGRAAAAGPDA